MRISWVDHCKAVAIFLVVYGHSLSVGWGIDRWIYAFHMPLFFLISGFLLSDRNLSLKFVDFCKKTLRSLLVPYLIFCAIGYVFWFCIGRNFGDDSGVDGQWFDPLVGMLLGTASHERFQVAPIVLWFLPCLFLAQLIAYGVCRLANLTSWRKVAASILISAIGFVLPIALVLPFELEEALVAQLFVVCGITIRRGGIVDRVSRPVVVGLVLLVVGSVLAFVNGKVDMRISDYGNPVLFVVNALSISIGIALVASKLTANRISEHLSSHTITIFPLHEMVFSIFSAVYVFVLSIDLAIRTHPVVGFVASLVNVMILAFAAPLVRRVIPWIYGEKFKSKVDKTTG